MKKPLKRHLQRSLGIPLGLLLLTLTTPHRSSWAQAPPRFSESPVRVGGGNWLLKWSTEAGAQYRLERSANLVDWQSVTTLTAAGAVAEHTDTAVPPAANKMFWRVVRLGGSDTLPPTVSILQVRRVAQNDVPFLELTVQAEDNISVVGVNYAEDQVLLGAASEGPTGTWKKIVPLDPGTLDPRQFQAAARDAAGNTGFSDIYTYVPEIQSAALLPLDDAGKVVPDALVGQQPDGSLNPFTLLPDVNGGGSPRHGLRVDFPDGGRLVTENGRTLVEGNRFVVRFGDESPVQFAADDGAGMEVNLPAGETRRLPLGEMPFAELAAALGINAAEGIPLEMFGIFELVWKGGTLTKQGIRGGRFTLRKPGLALGGDLGNFESTVLDWLGGGDLVLPFAGEIKLGERAKIIVSRARPLMLTLRADGEMALVGGANLVFVDGARFGVEVLLDDPSYCLTLRAGNLEVPLITSLAQLLPDSPADCVPGGFDEAALEHAETCLRASDRAYRLFLAAARGIRPAGPGDAVIQSVPTAADLTGAAADAWASLKAADLVASVPTQPMLDAIEALNRQSRNGGSDPATTVDAVVKLRELGAQIERLQTSDRANLEAAIETAVLDAKPALLKALQDPAVLSREVLGKIVAALASGFFSEDPALSQAGMELLGRAVAQEAAALGIVAGVINPTANPRLPAMNPYVALSVVRRLNSIEAAAQNAGLSALDLPLFNECIQQVFGHAYQTILAGADRALAERNPFGCLLFISELKQLQAEDEANGVAIVLVPSDARVMSLLNGSSSLLEQATGLSPQQDPNNPVTREQVFSLAKRFRSMLEIAARLPAGEAAVQSVATMLFRQLEITLPLATSPTALAATGDADALLATLEAGALHATLKRTFPALAGSFTWEGPAVGEAAARLAALATAAGDTALLGREFALLMTEADALEAAALANPAQAGALRQSRKRYFVVASQVLAAIHPLTQSEWLSTEQQRGADPAAVSADGFLPGDLKIDRMFGTICHNRLTGLTRGTLGGDLRLPKLASSLSIRNASLDSEGRFDLNASGVLQLPGAPDSPFVTMTVPRSQPLHISTAPGRPPVIAGRARLAFANGSFVGVGLRFADPVYSLQAEAGGLQVDLRDAVQAINSPQLGSVNLSPLWAGYYEGFSSWLEGFEEEEAPGEVEEPGEVPSYVSHIEFDVAPLLAAWLDRAGAEVTGGSAAFVNATGDEFRKLMTQFDDSLFQLGTAFNNLFAPDAEDRANNLLKRLGEIDEIYTKLAALMQEMADQQLSGDTSGISSQGLAGNFDAAGRMIDQADTALRADPELLKRPELVKQVAQAAIAVAVANQSAGLNQDGDLDQVMKLVEDGAAAYAADKGLNPDGTVVNAKVDAMTATEVEDTLRTLIELHSEANSAGSASVIPEAHLAALGGRLIVATLTDAKFNLTSGLIDTTLGDEELLAAVRRIHSAVLIAGPLVVPPPTLDPDFSFSAFLWQNELIQRAKKLSEDKWFQRFKFLEAAERTADLRGAAGGDPLANPDFQKEKARVLAQFNRQGRGRLKAEEIEYLKSLKSLVADPAVKAIYESRLTAAANEIAALLVPAWTERELALGRTLLTELAVIEELFVPQVSLAASLRPAIQLPLVSEKIKAVALPGKKGAVMAQAASAVLKTTEAPVETVAVRAAMGPANAAIYDTLSDDLKLPLASPAYVAAGRTQASSLLNGSREVLAVRAAAAVAGGPDLGLPGDLTIDRVFGGFFYHRVTGFFQGSFGGKLSFPDPRASFEITQATFDNTGGFQIAAATSLPVKVLDNDRATLSGTLAVAGNSGGLQNVSGSGLLSVPVGASGSKTYAGSFGYDANAPGKPLSFTASFSGAANELRLSDDLVIFEGSLGLAFGTDRPQLAIETGGKAGLFARLDVPPALTAELGREAGFWLVCDVNNLRLTSDETKTRVFLSGGTLDLAADIFAKSAAPVNASQRVKFSFAGALGAEVPFATGLPKFFAGGDPSAPFDLSGGGFAFGVPGIVNSKITVNTCDLRLFGGKLPVLRELDATFRFPLPGQDASNPAGRVPTFNLNVVDWGVDGFMPAGATVTLQNSLDIVALDGFGIEILGTDSNLPGCPPTALSFLQVKDGGEKFTRMSLVGGLRAKFSNELLHADPGVTPTAPAGQVVETTGALRVAASGEFIWDFRPNALPEFELGVLQVDGRFKLGGSALALGGAGTGSNLLATLRVPVIGNLTKRTATFPFEVSIAGALDVPEVGKFVLNGARFVWDQPASLAPKFFTNGGGVVLGDTLNSLLGAGMPLYMKELNLELKNDTLPLLGATPGNGLLDPKNLRLTLSAEASFPQALESGAPAAGPRFGGLVDGFTIEYPGGNLFEPKMSARTVALQLENLDIPPLAGITGQVALLNVGALLETPSRPQDVTFVGNLAAKFFGKGAGVLLAAKPTELVGAAFSVDASPAGIPLDGGALGGILWVGAEGGLNFKNQFSNPLNFRDYLIEDGFGNVTGADDFSAPDDPRRTANPVEDPLDNPGEKPPEVTVAAGQPFDPFDALKDNWPPRSANPLAEEFPINQTPKRFVFKGSRLSSADADVFLNRIGLTASNTLTPDQIIAAFIREMLVDVQAQAVGGLNAMFAASNLPNGTKTRAHFDSVTQVIVNSFDDAARPILRGILQPVGGGDPTVSARQRVRELLTQGIPIFNVTFVGSGTFTHAAVSAALSIKGTVSASTTGAAMAKGELLLSGIPVAEASVGISLTNEAGKISPFLGGLAQVGIGPLEFGKMTMSAAMPDSTAVLAHFAEFIGRVDAELNASAQAHLKLLIAGVKGRAFAFPPGVSIAAFMSGQMNDAERLALIANLFNTVLRTATALDDPTTPLINERAALLAQLQLAEGDLLSLLSCFETFVADTMNSLSPEIVFGGKLSPSIFDIPMTGSGMPVASARMRYGRALNGDGDLINPVDPSLKAVSASVQFSPTFMLLAPLTGTFVALNPTNAALAGFTAVDTADMSMSFLIPGWTQPKVRGFLTNQPKFFSDRTREFFDSAVFGAGYEMRPFGMELADAELRVIFPQSALHPLNPARPGGPWVHPQRERRTLTSTLPTRDELILAALQADKLGNADFRGAVGELDDLFPPAGTPPPSTGCSSKVVEVANQLRAVDPDLSDLSAKSFAADYFPHGGIIGAGQLSFPKIVTRGLPPQIASLATLPTTNAAAAQWLTELGAVLEFLASSDCVGQLGFYLPASNPLLLPGESQADLAGLPIDQYLKRLQMDPLALIGRTANQDLYPLDEIVFTGWARAQILGLPIGEALVNYDQSRKCFLAQAQVPPNSPGDGNWLNDFVQAQATFEIKLPSGQDSAGLKMVGITGLFQQVGSEFFDFNSSPPTPKASFLALSLPEKQAKIQQLRNAMFEEMPKIALEVGAGFGQPGTVNLPQGLGKFAADASLGLFAFSPYYEPGFEASNNRPYAQARRNGGIGLKGSMQLGYFPVPGQPPFFSVNVPDASFAVKLTEGIAPVPSFVANLEVADITLPQGFAFNGQTTPPMQFKNGRLFIDTAAPVGGNSLMVQGKLTPIDLSPFLKVMPLAADANPGNLLSGALQVRKTATGEAVEMVLSPAQATMPLLGAVSGKIFGTKLANGTFTPFTFSSFPGQPWAASVEMGGSIELRDPFNFLPTGDVLFRATPPGGTAFSGSVEGIGLEQFTLRMQITNGWTVELFPGKPHGSKFTIGDNSLSSLHVRSDGRFYYDSGTRVIPLGGLTPATAVATVQGRIEFGYNPPAPAPTITVGTISAFSSLVGSSAEKTLTVTASGAPARGHVVVDALVGSANTIFSVSPSRLVIPAGGSGQFKVRYSPRTNGGSSVSLSISPEGQAAVVRSLSGTPILAADLRLTETTVDFGTVGLHQPKARALRINNVGNASATITVPAATAPFTYPATNLFITGGGAVNLPITFRPTILGASTQTLTLGTNSPSQPSLEVQLTGNGNGVLPLWRRMRPGDGTDPLQAVAVRSGSPGVIVAGGPGGAFLTNQGNVFAWERNKVAGGSDINDLVIPTTTLGWAVGKNGLALRSPDGGTSWVAFIEAVANTADWKSVARISSSTQFVAFAGSVKGKTDGVIVRQIAVSTFAAAVIPTNTNTLHGITFNTSNIGVAVGANRTLLRSTDGGANWSSITAPAALPAGVALRGVAALGGIFIAVGDGGAVLRSADSGATWTLLTGIPSTAQLNDVSVFQPGSTLWHIVGDGGTVFSSTSNTTIWTAEEISTLENLTAVQSFLASLLVSESGEIFVRGTSGGGTTPIASVSNHIDVGHFQSMLSGQRAHGEVIVTNSGGGPMTATLTASNPTVWPVTPSGEQTIPPGGSLRFSVQHTSDGSSSANTFTLVTNDPALPSLAIAVNKTDSKTGVNLSVAYLHGPSSVDLGTVGTGVLASATVSLQNLGIATAGSWRYSIRSQSPTGTFTLVSNSTASLAAGAARNFTARFQSSTPGLHRAVIEVHTDSWNGVLPIEIQALVPVTPEDIVLRSNSPFASSLDIDGTAVNLPTVLQVANGPTNIAGSRIQRGATVELFAPSSVPGVGVEFQFKEWTGGTNNVLSLTAGASPRIVTASYVRTVPASAVPPAPTVLPPSNSPEPPADSPAGPWFKLSQARLTAPWLGSGGSQFKIEGAAFASLTRLSASLSSSRITVNVPNHPNMLFYKNGQLLEITPSSWRFSLTSDATLTQAAFNLRCDQPGLKVLAKNVLPPASLTLNVQSNSSGPLGTAAVSFTTTDDLVILPQILALGPFSMNGEIGLNAAQPVFNLSGTTTWKALARSEGIYAINQSGTFNFNPALPAITPLPVAQNTEFDFLVAKLKAGAGASVGLGVTGTAFNFQANNWKVRPLGSDTELGVSISAASDGSFLIGGNLDAATGFRPFAAAPLQFVPQSSLNTEFLIQGRPLVGKVQLGLPALFVNSTDATPLWTNNRVAIPAFDFDSSNFQKRVVLPSFSFRTFTVEGDSSPDPDNYFEVAASSTSTRATLRSRQNFVLGALRMDFDLNDSNLGSPLLTANLSGRLGLENPSPLNQASDQISLLFNSATPIFELNRTFFLSGGRFKLGASGSGFTNGRACLLTPNAGAIPTWAEAACFP